MGDDDVMVFVIDYWHSIIDPIFDGDAHPPAKLKSFFQPCAKNSRICRTILPKMMHCFVTDMPQGLSVTFENSSAVTTGTSPEKEMLRTWLNKNLKIEMTDGRVLIGIFLCTDRDGNVILGSCHEYLKTEDSVNVDDARGLGLVMVPGRHIVAIHLDHIAN